MSNFVDVVVYLEQPDQDLYHAELNQTLLQLLSDIGWVLPRLTNAEVTAFTADIPVGAQWFNTDAQKMQIMTTGGVETITSA